MGPKSPNEFCLNLRGDVRLVIKVEDTIIELWIVRMNDVYRGERVIQKIIAWKALKMFWFCRNLVTQETKALTEWAGRAFAIGYRA